MRRGKMARMSNWIVCLPRDDIKHCLEVSTFGLSRSHTISRVRDGDRVAFVVTKEKPWRLLALGKVVGDYYIDVTPVFKRQGAFPDRFKFEILRTLKDEPDFQSLLIHLKAITRPEYWPVFFKMGILQIADSDWKQIEERVLEVV